MQLSCSKRSSKCQSRHCSPIDMEHLLKSSSNCQVLPTSNSFVQAGGDPETVAYPSFRERRLQIAANRMLCIQWLQVTSMKGLHFPLQDISTKLLFRARPQVEGDGAFYRPHSEILDGRKGDVLVFHFHVVKFPHWIDLHKLLVNIVHFRL